MMKQGILRCFVFILAGMSWALNSAAQDEDIERMKRESWQMTMSLKTTKLKPPAVQWTVFDKDPVPGFHARVKRMKAFYADRIEKAEGNAEKELARSSGMMVSWDKGFGEVSGDKLYLLTRARGVSHGFASNESDGKKWIVSKTVQVKGKPVCWCIPVTVETGKSISITLSEDNMFDLENAFDRAMEEDK